MKQFILCIARLFIPLKLRQKIRALNQSMMLNHHLAKISSNAEPYLNESDESVYLMNRLIYGWGNPDWSADAFYLIQCAQQAKKANGMVLECGSGLTTLVMAVVKNDDVKIVAMEHHPQWASKIRGQLDKLRCMNIEIVDSPLIHYESFEWYDFGACLLEGISLVICDGPPSTALGGRIGLLPLVYKFMKSKCLVLLDDFQRIEEQCIVQSWSDEYLLVYQIFGKEKKYAHIEIDVSGD